MSNFAHKIDICSNPGPQAQQSVSCVLWRTENRYDAIMRGDNATKFLTWTSGDFGLATFYGSPSRKYTAQVVTRYECKANVARILMYHWIVALQDGIGVRSCCLHQTTMVTGWTCGPWDAFWPSSSCALPSSLVSITRLHVFLFGMNLHFNATAESDMAQLELITRVLGSWSPDDFPV